MYHSSNLFGVRSGWLDKTNKPTTRHVCMDVAISLRTAQEPERKTFVPVQAEAVRQVQVQLLGAVPQLPV